MIGSVSQGFVARFYDLRPVRLLIIAALTFFSVWAKGQQFEVRLNWSTQLKTYHTTAGKSITQPTFTNATASSQYDLLPVYNLVTNASISSGKVAVEILNPVYAPAGAIDNASLKFIKTTATAYGRISLYHKRPKLGLTVLPFRKNPGTGAIERLESFTLKATVTSSGQAKSLHSYAANSVLASGTWFKLSVNADGIYKIDFNFIKKNLGIDPSTINLSTLAIFGNGGGMVPDVAGGNRPDDLTENPTLFVDNNGNGKFDNGDFLLFYGQMADAWNYDTSSQTFSHQKNLYTDVNYYFLTTDAGTGKRVQTVSTGLIPSKTITTFDDHAYHDSDIVNLLESGKEWLGEEMTSFSNTQSLSFNFPNIVTGSPVKVVSELGISVPNSPSTTSLSINGQTVLTQTDAGISINSGTEYPDLYEPNQNSGSFTANSAQMNVTYTFSPQSDPSGSAACYIDWIELTAQRQLSLFGNAMTFRSIASTSVPACNFVLGNAGSSTVVWNVTSLGSISQMPGTLSGSNLSFTAATSQLQEFIAFNTNASFNNPVFVGSVPNQNLHAMGQPNMVIVVYDDFLSAANDLASYHRANDHITVTVVPVSQVYNEFGSGKPDISAIRDMIKMPYDRGGSDSALWPRCLLLFGDGSFDPKNRIADANNYINCYESYDSYEQIYSYTSDDFFGLLDDGDGGDIGDLQYLDIGVGRLTADDETSAQNMVNKVKNYRNLTAACATCVTANTNNSWRNVLSFVADYPYQGVTDFEVNSEELAESTRASYPVYNYSKIYCDAYKLDPTPAGDRFPDCNAAILNQLNTGTLVINWVGHGDEVTWSNGRIFTYSEIQALQNQYWPLFITATCDFSRYDQPSETGGETLLANASGGAIALISTVRLVYESSNTSIDDAVYDNNLFATSNGTYPILGQIIMNSKNNSAVTGDPVNDRKFTLLGDPALTLDYPQYNIVTDSVDHKLVTLPHDTLKALSQITVSGHVTDYNNNKLTSFSGTVYPEIFDKISHLQTLNNNDYGTVEPFVEYTSTLFKGTASIANGSFSFSFIVPKDINYQYGPGRISYYADNGVSTTANGYSNAITVGGASDTAHSRTIGPKMTLYMNDANFVNGGITNASPLMLVELQDPGGINTTGNGVGHNLTAIVDNNYQSPVILNNYYQSALNDFTKGEIRYPFSNLTAGNHTVQVKAWDIYDNSAEGTIEFVVTNNAQLSLNHVYNYPNPFTTHTEFMFEDNSPCDQLDVSIQIYSVSGRLVKNIVQQVQPTGYRVDGIVWDGLDDYGSPIGKGVYIYKLSVKDQTTGNSAHKFEKLVLLR